MPHKISEIARVIGGIVIGDENLEIMGIADIQQAREGEITFLANNRYRKYLKETAASAVIVPIDITEGEGKTLIQTDDPYFAFMKAVRFFYPEEPLIESGVHSTALIGEGTELGEDVSIGCYAVIGRNCRIGKGSKILPHAVIGDRVKIGTSCLIHSNVNIRERVEIGSRVIIHNGAVIGSDGFGFAPKDGIYHKIPQVGTVVIEDDVEIGANCTIDRATLGETRIKKGVKLDNLIQVGHNCTIGENTVIAAQAGLSGSTHIGKGVRVGGQVGFAGHMKIGDGAMIGAQSGVSKSVPPGVMMFGYPAKPRMEEFRLQAAIKKLPDLLQEIKDLKKQIKELEQRVVKKNVD